MDTLLMNGDHCRDGRGLPVMVSGRRELVQQALIRLCVKKGSFAPDPGLGSELYKLARPAAGAMDRLAFSYVQEALAPMPVAVEAVHCSRGSGGEWQVEAELSGDGERFRLEVNGQG